MRISRTKETAEDYYFKSKTPGVYLREEFRLPRRRIFDTGVPVLLGLVPHPSERIGNEVKPKPHMLSLWSHFVPHIGKPDCNLAYAVRGFYQNGGGRCYVVVLKNDQADGLQDGLDAIAPLNTIDLVCAPDLVKNIATDSTYAMQQLVVNHCEAMGERFAILDSPEGATTKQVGQQWSYIDGNNGAIYYPWLKVRAFDDSGFVAVPPCGHVAGVYARTDRTRGVHKAPANELLEGVVDLERHLTNADQDDLNPNRVNCLRSFPGRGIRVWGARTLSGQDAWTYVNVRRLFLTAIRWIEWNMQDVVFEPNNQETWAWIERDLRGYFLDLYQQGALKGQTPQEAFYVKCNADTNPLEVRELGRVVTEVGLAPMNPYEFVVVRLIQDASGVTISGPIRPDQNL